MFYVEDMLKKVQVVEMVKSFHPPQTELGGVMLDVQPFEITKLVPSDWLNSLYFTTNLERFWISGAVAETSAHCTLLFGLLSKAVSQPEAISDALEGWIPPALKIASVGVFASSYEDEDYDCVVAEIAYNSSLLDGHRRLKKLPHVDLFPNYKPHLTLLYVQKGQGSRWADVLNEKLVGKTFEVTGLSYT